MIVILLIVLSLVSIAAITIVVAQNTACKDCPFKRTCDELLSQNQLNLCQQNNMPREIINRCITN